MTVKVASFFPIADVAFHLPLFHHASLITIVVYVFQAAERDKGKKGKISKKRKKGKKKASKKGKKKKDKDLTPDRTPESLFEELVLNGIIKNYPKTSLDSYLGEANFVGAILKREGKDPSPGAGDIRRVLTEYCILPMSESRAFEGVKHKLTFSENKD